MVTGLKRAWGCSFSPLLIVNSRRFWPYGGLFKIIFRLDWWNTPSFPALAMSALKDAIVNRTMEVASSDSLYRKKTKHAHYYNKRIWGGKCHIWHPRLSRPYNTAVQRVSSYWRQLLTLCHYLYLISTDIAESFHLHSHALNLNVQDNYAALPHGGETMASLCDSCYKNDIYENEGVAWVFNSQITLAGVLVVLTAIFQGSQCGLCRWIMLFSSAMASFPYSLSPSPINTNTN